MSTTLTACIYALLALEFNAAESDFDYGFSIDAGTTGTRIYAYRWAPRMRNASSDSHVQSRPREVGDPFKTSPISSITSLATAVSLLTPMIDHVKNITFSESSRWNEFPIILKAT
eukprot:255392_1